MKSYFKSRTFITLILILAISLNIVFIQEMLYSEVNNKSFKNNTLKLNAPDITIITPENTTYTEPMNGYYLATYGFENDISGGYPSMWEIDDTYGTVKVIEELDGHKKVLELEDTSDLGNVIVNQTFSLQGFGTVELWWRLNDTSKRATVALKNSITDNPVITLLWQSDLNSWRYAIGSSWYDIPNIPNPVANTWYRMIIDFERTTGNYQGLGQNKWNVNFNGVNSGELNLRNNENVDAITILTPYALNQDFSFYIDAVGYSWDPTYNRGDNLNEGLLLSFENSTSLDWIGYSLDGQANNTILGNSTFPFPSHGLHTIQVFGNDTLGKIHHSNITYFTIKVISIITPENKIYTEPMSGYYLATFGFENDILGGYPSMWEIDDTYGTVKVIEELDGHKKVLELEDTSDLGNVIVNQTFSLQGFGTVELWWRLNDTSKRATVALKNSIADNPVITLLWNGDLNSWRYAIGSSWYDVPNIPNPVANTWYRMIFDFERTTGNYQGLGQNKWNVNFNGVNSGELNLRNNEDVNALTILTPYALNQDFSFYIDAVGYSWDPTYNRGDNFYEGLLLSFQNTIALDWMGYSLDGQANNTILGNSTITFPEDGLHTIQVFGNNSRGENYESDVMYFSVDTSSPIISIISPDPDEYFGSTAPNFEIEVIELSSYNTWYTIDNGITNITFSGLTGSINQTEWDKKGDEMVSIRFYANDTWGFEGFSEVIVYKDTTPPVSSLLFTPYSGTNEVIKSTIFTITADDGSGSGISIRQYKINDSSWITYTGPFDLSSYDYGDYLISYRAIDNVGNIETENTELVTLVKEPSKPPIIHGFDLWIIIGLFSIVSMIIIRKKLKK